MPNGKGHTEGLPVRRHRRHPGHAAKRHASSGRDDENRRRSRQNLDNRAREGDDVRKLHAKGWCLQPEHWQDMVLPHVYGEGGC